MVYATPFGIAVNINKLYSALSKEGKDARRLQRTLTRDYESDEIDRLFSKEMVKNATHLDGKELDNFISEYRPSYNWIKTASDYELILYIKEKLQQFLKNREQIHY